PKTVSFTDLSTPDVTSWSWSFGDGATSSEQNPVHLYTAGGTFDVSLTVTAPGGRDTRVRQGLIVLDWSLTAFFDIQNPGGVAPVIVQFLDRSMAGPTSWRWDFGDGGSSTLQNPAHTFRSGGRFFVQLTVANASATSSTTVPVD